MYGSRYVKSLGSVVFCIVLSNFCAIRTWRQAVVGWRIAHITFLTDSNQNCHPKKMSVLPQTKRQIAKTCFIVNSCSVAFFLIIKWFVVLVKCLKHLKGYKYSQNVSLFNLNHWTNYLAFCGSQNIGKYIKRNHENVFNMFVNTLVSDGK